MMLCMLVGCGNGNGASSNKDITKKTSTTDTINVEDIDWNVDERIIDGRKCLSFNYTNNTKYTITEVQLKFTQKEGTTSEDLKVFDSVREQGYNGKDEEIYILGYNLRHAEPGEYVQDTPCMIENLGFTPDDIRQYEIMEPNEMQISYIGSDNKMHICGYDFINKKSILSNDTEDIYTWTDNEYSKNIPKPNAKVVTCNEGDYYYGFAIWGQSREDYENYIKECKNKVFTLDIEEYNNSWTAKNEKGYIIDMGYTETREKIGANVQKVEK